MVIGKGERAVEIGGRFLTGAAPKVVDPYVIAELGVNHDGSVERALELTRAAAGAGADAVKLQLFETDRLMSKAAKLAVYQKAAGETDPVAMLRRLEMGIDDMARVVELAHGLGIHAIVTVFSVELVEVAERLEWDAYKTASPDIVHRPLLEELMGTEKPMIVSTGASTMEEVERAVGWLEGARERLTVMQCVSSYPTPEDRAEIGVVAELESRLGVPVGYSDHTRGHATGMHAVYGGACMLEKHLTYDRNAAGPDHRASLTPELMKEYVRLACEGVNVRRGMRVGEDNERLRKMAWLMERQGREKKVLDIEQDVRALSRQSVVLRRGMKVGERVGRGDVTFKRPGTGMLACRVDEVVGKVLARDVEGDAPVVEGELKW